MPLRLVGSYSAKRQWKGELVNHEHTPNQGDGRCFGGPRGGIVFSGNSIPIRARSAAATALAVQRSIAQRGG